MREKVKPNMKIVVARPPIWEEAHKHFEIDDNATIYAYGDFLYNPAGVPINDELLAHETQHALQQYREGGPAAWWKRYFADPVFRASQEAEAYAAQYIAFTDRNHDRNAAARYLYQLGGLLASGMYRLTMQPQEARAAIQKAVTSLE